MPTKSGVPCNWRGCPRIIPSGTRWCTDHKTVGEKKADAWRDPAHLRGYDTRWHNYRNFFLRSNPVCGCGKVATVVDHIIPATGPNDPLFYAEDNHQALCRRCHDEKTTRDIRERRTVSERTA